MLVLIGVFNASVEVDVFVVLQAFNSILRIANPVMYLNDAISRMNTTLYSYQD